MLSGVLLHVVEPPTPVDGAETAFPISTALSTLWKITPFFSWTSVTAAPSSVP